MENYLIIIVNSAADYISVVEMEGAEMHSPCGLGEAEVARLSTMGKIPSALEAVASYLNEDLLGPRMIALKGELVEAVKCLQGRKGQKVESFILSAWELGINPLPALRKQGFTCDSSHDEFAVISSPAIGELKIDWK